MKKLICLLLILSSLLSLTACRTDDEDEKKYKTRSLTISNIYFNTVSTIHTYADESDENIEKWANIADETLSYYHKLFDIYYEYSGVNNIKTINRNAGKSAVKVDEEMIDFLVSDEPFCSVELFDFLLQLSRIKFLICKAYIFCYEDDEIAVLLNITKERLDEIKLELQEDIRKGYLV